MKYSRSYLLDKPKPARKRRRLLLFMLVFLLLVLAAVYAINVISTFNSFHNEEEWAQELRLQGSGNEIIYLMYGLDYWGARPVRGTGAAASSRYDFRQIEPGLHSRKYHD